MRPLSLLAAMALFTPLANGALTAQSVWEQTALLAAASPYHDPLDRLGVLHLVLFALAAWSVIRWCDAAQDNLPALENRTLPDRLHALYWLTPGIQVALPGLGIAALSRHSNPEHDPATGEGPALATVLPWAILARSHSHRPVRAAGLVLIRRGKPPRRDLADPGGSLLELAALPFLLHIIAETSAQQLRRHRDVNKPYRPIQPVRTPPAPGGLI